MQNGIWANQNMKYKGRTDSNTSTQPNKDVRVTTHYYYGIYKRTAKCKAHPHPCFPSTEDG